MSDLLHELATLRAMVKDFNDFVRSDTVFWQLSDSGPFLKRFPRLTIAGILFCQHKLAVLNERIPAENQEELQYILTQFDQSICNWRTNVERKALREIGGRLHSWKWYLSDCREDSGDCTVYYATEVYSRVYIHFLLKTLRNLSAANTARAQAEGADSELRTVFHTGTFVWDHDLSDAFPPEEYWFLYGRPGYP